MLEVKTQLRPIWFSIVLLVCSLQAALAEQLRFGLPEGFAPYSFKSESGWNGIDYELVSALHQRMGLNVSYIGMPWARQMTQAENGLLAGILTVYCADHKDYLAIVPEPLYEVRISLFTLQDTELSLDHNFSAMPLGTKVGIVRGNFFGEVLDSYPAIEKIEANTTTQLIQQLVRGRLDYVLEETLPFHFFGKGSDSDRKFLEARVIQTNTVCTAFSIPFFGDRTQVLVEQASREIKEMKRLNIIDKIESEYIKQ